MRNLNCLLLGKNDCLLLSNEPVHCIAMSNLLNSRGSRVRNQLTSDFEACLHAYKSSIIVYEG